uniref:hypothetical protein n=1 Tax=Endozoicomonas arenosclerae TaxID=1633495 RepID=UPI000783FA82
MTFLKSNQKVSFNNVFLLFLVVNSFYIVPPLNSSMLAGIFVAGEILLRRDKYAQLVKKNISWESIIIPAIFIVVMLLFSALIPVLHGTKDFSYSKNFISTLIQFFIITLLVLKIYSDCLESQAPISKHFEYLLVTVFLIQSVIQLFAFSYPSFASIVHISYKELAIERLYENYNGARGLALTGSPGWGLSVGYSLAYLFYTKYYLVDRSISLKSALIGFVLVLGGIFAGRSAYLGVIVSLIYYLLCHKKLEEKFKELCVGSLYLAFFTLVFYVFFPSLAMKYVKLVFPYAFEAVYQYQSTGVAQTTSTNNLKRMWEVPFNLRTFFLGDGILTDHTTGSYYKRTDVGYMRNLLFGGAGWIVMLLLYQYFIGPFKFISKCFVDNRIKLFLIC